MNKVLGTVVKVLAVYGLTTIVRDEVGKRKKKKKIIILNRDL